MKYVTEEKRLHLVLDAGEEVIGSLVGLARKEKIKSSSFTGIGALGDVELGFFDVEKKEYLRKEFHESRELVSLVGSIAWDGDEPVVHAHAALGGPDYGVAAGHLFRGTVTVTGEIFMLLNDSVIRRSPDGRFGLKLIDLSGTDE